MPSLLNPWVLLAIVLTVLGAFGSGYYKGEKDEYDRSQIEIASLNAEARQSEQRMGEVARTYAETLRKSQNAAKVKENKLHNDIVSGKLRVFVPVKAPECAVHPATDSPVAIGNTETRAELDSGVAQALVDLTSRGDSAIRQLNTCIDQYNEMRNFK